MIKQRLPSAVTTSNKLKVFENLQPLKKHNQRNIKFQTESAPFENIHTF
jgi:hypothetical protein